MIQGPRIHGRPAGHFLAGDPKWWTPPAGPFWSKAKRDESEEEKMARTKRNLASLTKREVSIPESCQNWRRQRLRQIGTGFLLPAALSPMFVIISLMFLFFDNGNGFPPEIPIIASALALGLLVGSLAAFRERRIGTANMWRSIVPALVIPIAVLCTWGPWRVSGLEGPLTILMDGIAIAFLTSASKAVSKDGARFLLPVSTTVELRVHGSTVAWSEGRIHREVVARSRVLELSGERIRGQRFLVLDHLGHLDVRWDPLHETTDSEVRRIAVSFMQESDPLAVEWPEWALPREVPIPSDRESE